MRNNLNIEKARTCVYSVQYRLVWSVKKRQQVLTPEMVKYLQQCFVEIAEEKEFAIIGTPSITPDVITIDVTGHPKLAPFYMVKMLKGISGRRLLIEFPELKTILPKGQLWNSTFYLETIGTENKEATQAYLQNQYTRG